jgi:DNA primase
MVRGLDESNKPGDPAGDAINLEGLRFWPRKPRFERYDPNDYDVLAVAAELLGPAPGRRAAAGYWWHCPIHQSDNNPSMIVDPERNAWFCHGPCGKGGGAIELVMATLGISFIEGKDWLREHFATAAGSARPGPGEAAKKAGGKPAPRTGVSRRDAEDAAKVAVQTWSWSGSEAKFVEPGRRYLHDRGLSDATIRAACLGYSPSRIEYIHKKLRNYITIPWYDSGRLVSLKLRFIGHPELRYMQMFSDDHAVYPSLAAIRPGLPLVIVEGEFDCLLLQQELGDLASVITTGSTNQKPSAALLEAARAASRIYAGHDIGDAGDRAAMAWPGAVRARPPVNKDWTDVYKNGYDLRDYWRGILGI